MLPPGPPSLPFIGSIPFVDKKRGWADVLMNESLYKYDPNLCTVWVGSRPFIVIQNFALAKELFSRDEFTGRTNSYHNRYVRGIEGECLGIVSTMGRFWQEQRRFTLKHLKDLGFGRRKLDTIIQDEAKYLIDDLLTKSNKGDVLIQSLFNFPIINILWQIIASKKYDPDLPESKSMMRKISRLFYQGSTLINLLIQSPFLRSRLPQPEHEKEELDLKDLFRQQILEHEHERKQEESPESRDFIDIYLREIEQRDETMDHTGDGKYSNFNIEQLVVICLDFFQAGSETSSTTLSWAVMFLALYTDVQEKCRNEIDLLLGGKFTWCI